MADICQKALPTARPVLAKGEKMKSQQLTLLHPNFIVTVIYPHQGTFLKW